MMAICARFSLTRHNTSRSAPVRYRRSETSLPSRTRVVSRSIQPKFSVVLRNGSLQRSWQIYNSKLVLRSQSFAFSSSRLRCHVAMRTSALSFKSFSCSLIGKTCGDISGIWHMTIQRWKALACQSVTSTFSSSVFFIITTRTCSKAMSFSIIRARKVGPTS